MDPSSTQSGPSNKTLNKKRLLQLIVTLGYLNIEVVQATAGKGANSRRPAKNTVDSTRDEVMDAFLDILAALPAVKGDTLAVAVGNWKSGLEEISVYLASNRAVHPRVEGILRDFWVKLQSLHALMLSSQIDHIILEQQRTALLSFVMQTMHAKLKSRVKKYSSLFFEYRYRISPNKSTAYEVVCNAVQQLHLLLDVPIPEPEQNKAYSSTAVQSVQDTILSQKDLDNKHETIANLCRIIDQNLKRFLLEMGSVIQDLQDVQPLVVLDQIQIELREIAQKDDFELSFIKRYLDKITTSFTLISYILHNIDSENLGRMLALKPKFITLESQVAQFIKIDENDFNDESLVQIIEQAQKEYKDKFLGKLFPVTLQYFQGRKMLHANMSITQSGFQKVCIHCECKLLAKTEYEGLDVYPYFGISKLCCYACHIFFSAFQEYKKSIKGHIIGWPGCHNKLYGLWVFPSPFEDQTLNDFIIDYFQRKLSLDLLETIQSLKLGREFRKISDSTDASSIRRVSNFSDKDESENSQI